MRSPNDVRRDLIATHRAPLLDAEREAIAELGARISRLGRLTMLTGRHILYTRPLCDLTNARYGLGLDVQAMVGDADDEYEHHGYAVEVLTVASPNWCAITRPPRIPQASPGDLKGKTWRAIQRLYWLLERESEARAAVMHVEQTLDRVRAALDVLDRWEADAAERPQDGRSGEMGADAPVGSHTGGIA